MNDINENAAWHKVFTSGSEALKSKLKKTHAKNPKFQEFLKSIGHEGAQKSVAQAKKDVGDINKKKARMAAIATAATSKKNKELVSSSERVREMGRRRREGGEGLGGGLETNRDIISYVKAGGTIKAGRLGEEVVDEASSPEKKRMFDLKLKMMKIAANRPAKSTAKQATTSNSPVDKEDARDAAASMKHNIVAKYGKHFAEDVEQTDEALLPKQQKVRQDLIDKEMAEKKAKRQAGTAYGHYASLARKMRKMQEEVVVVDEATKQEAEKVLGGAVQTRTGNEPAGKHPLGYRNARRLARAKLKQLLTQRKGK